MGLYTHSLYLLREAARGSLVDDLRAAGLVAADDGASELPGILGTPSEGTVDALTLVEFAPEDGRFDEFLRVRGDELVSWLWTAFEKADVLYAFVPGGGDFKYYEDGVPTDQLTWTQLGELVDTGRVRVVHPLMMFATRLGHGRPCLRARELEWGLKEFREGIGCVIGVVRPTPGGFELLEPGDMYPSLRRQWEVSFAAAASSRGRNERESA